MEQLLDRLSERSQSIQTLTAKVEFEPTAGSVYSGVIKEYRDVKGFILLKRPGMIRMVGQAPVVRTNIFDMVSDGQEFRLYIPPKRKFIVGKTATGRPAKNALENLRPQHILDALLVSPIDPRREKFSYEESQEGGRRYYVISVFNVPGAGEMFPLRKVWFDRLNLEVSRLDLYGPRGAYIENVQYSGYQDFQGVRYPTRIEVTRPVEDYHLAITIQEAKFNQPLGPEKFELKKPESAELVELSEAARPETSHGK